MYCAAHVVVCVCVCVCVSPDQVFDEVRPLVTSVLDGYNVCIFAYVARCGQQLTSSGGAPDVPAAWLFRLWLCCNGLCTAAMGRRGRARPTPWRATPTIVA